AGLYRHVWLAKTGPLHVIHAGVFVRSEVSDGEATLVVTTELMNNSDTDQRCHVVSRVVDRGGTIVAEAPSEDTVIPAGAQHAFQQRIRIRKPSLWSIEDPTLYTLATELRSGSAIADSCNTNFGIRTIRF